MAIESLSTGVDALGEVKRVLFGNAPAAFTLEVFLRTIIVYLFLLGVLRLLGKRMTGQLTITEMGVMVSLGAIVSLPMQSQERGVLIGIVLLLAVLVLQRGLGRAGFERRKIELLTQGDLSLLVKDGVILIHELRRAAFSRHQLFGLLRAKD